MSLKTALFLIAPFAIAGAALVPGCAKPSPAPEPSARAASGGVSVFVSIPPQAYFVEKVAGERVKVEVLVGPGQSPHTYEPPPRRMAALSEADALFTIGVPFESALIVKIRGTAPDLEIVDTTEGIALRTMEAHREHDGEPAHGHEGAKDPHTWLDPTLVKTQACTIRDALTRLDPAGKTDYEANCAGFLDELDALDAELAEALAPLEGRTLMVFHPSFGYFADRYGLRQIAIETEGKEPGPRELAGMVARARTEGVGAIFIQQEFASTSAEAIAEEVGCPVVRLDPLARDYLAGMRSLAAAVKDALGAE